MTNENRTLKVLVARWRTDLRELTAGLTTDPLVTERGRHWDRDFPGEISRTDIHYGIFLVVLSLIPASVVAYTSGDVAWRVLNHLFGAPLQAIISGFLTACLIFLGAHLNRVPKSFTFALKLTFRVMSIYPLLGFLLFSSWGGIPLLLVYGFFVVRGVRKSFMIPLRNVLLFWGTAYVVFALLQFQALLSPPSGDRLRYFSMAFAAMDTTVLRGRNLSS